MEELGEPFAAKRGGHCGMMVQHFVFASEVRALLASGIVPRQFDATALVDYLRFQLKSKQVWLTLM